MRPDDNILRCCSSSSFPHCPGQHLSRKQHLWARLSLPLEGSSFKARAMLRAMNGPPKPQTLLIPSVNWMMLAPLWPQLRQNHEEENLSLQNSFFSKFLLLCCLHMYLALPNQVLVSPLRNLNQNPPSLISNYATISGYLVTTKVFFSILFEYSFLSLIIANRGFTLF